MTVGCTSQREKAHADVYKSVGMNETPAYEGPAPLTYQVLEVNGENYCYCVLLVGFWTSGWPQWETRS